MRGLLGSGRDHVEADVGEEHQRGPEEDAADAVGSGRPGDQLEQRGVQPLARTLGRHRRRDERVVVVGVDETDARHDHEQDDEELDPDQHQVDPHRLLDAVGHDRGEDRDEQERRQVEGVAVAETLGPGDADLVEERLEVRRPALRHDRRAEHHLEQQVPADDPGDHLAEGGVGERVRRPGHRHRRGELGVAQRREPTADGREHERQGDRRPGVGLRDATGEGEDAGPDDHADAEDGEVDGGQATLELELRVLGVFKRLLDALGPKQVHPRQPSGPLGCCVYSATHPAISLVEPGEPLVEPPRGTSGVSRPARPPIN